MRGGELRTKEQIEKEISRIEAVPEKDRDEKRRCEAGYAERYPLFDSEYYVYVRNGKGGRERLSPIIGKNAGQIVERIRSTPKGEKVWKYVNGNADIHSYRAQYATDIYRAHARPIEKIPYDKVNRGTGKRYQSEVYSCGRMKRQETG